MPGFGRIPRHCIFWWARRPLAAARAVIFAQMVNDPSWKWDLEHPSEIPPNNLKASWAASRKRLFADHQRLVKWENTPTKTYWRKRARKSEGPGAKPANSTRTIRRRRSCSIPRSCPPSTIPLPGGGALPLEAQRLGLEAYASDLNPVAVLINKAIIEIRPNLLGGRR